MLNHPVDSLVIVFGLIMTILVRRFYLYNWICVCFLLSNGDSIKLSLALANGHSNILNLTMSLNDSLIDLFLDGQSLRQKTISDFFSKK